MPLDRLILLVGLITYGMGQSLLFVIFTPLARKLGLEDWQVGFLIAGSNIALAFSAPCWGAASQRLGRRRVFLTGLGGFAVGYAGLALGVQAGLAGLLEAMPLFIVLFFLRLAYGVVVGGIGPAATAYIADTTDERSRSQGMALVSLSGGLGTIIGPLFGGALATVGPVFPMYAAAALALLAGAWAFAALPEPARRASGHSARRLRFFDPRIFPYMIGWIVVFGVFTGVQTITAFFIADRLGVSGVTAGQRTIMIAMTGMAIVTVLVQVVVLQAWKARPGTMLKAGFAVLALSLVCLAAAENVWMLYLGYAGFGLSFGLTAPGLNAAGSLSVEAGEQGAVAGLLAAAPTVGMIFGPILCGLVYRLAPVLPMAAGAALAMLLTLWFFFVKVPDPVARPAA